LTKVPKKCSNKGKSLSKDSSARTLPERNKVTGNQNRVLVFTRGGVDDLGLIWF